MTVHDPWARQLDGRLIQQHMSIIEPELQALQLERLARLVRTGAISGDIARELSRPWPAARASAFLLETLLDADHRLDAEILADFILDGLPVDCIIRMDWKDTGTCVSTEKFRPCEWARGLEFIPRLAIGAVITFGSRVSGPDTISGDADAARSSGVLVLRDGPLTDEALIAASSSALFAQWVTVEEGALFAAGKRFASARADHRETFSSNVLIEYRHRLGSEQGAKAFNVEPPATPACRDLFMAWVPAENRAQNTIGSAINHCVSLSDVVKVYDPIQ